MATPQSDWYMRVSSTIRPPLPTTTPSVSSSAQGQLSASPAIFSWVPTVTKNSPSSTSRKGRTSVSIWWRYSVSASITPARKAPSASDRPICWVSQAAASDSSRMVRVNSSME